MADGRYLHLDDPPTQRSPRYEGVCISGPLHGQQLAHFVPRYFVGELFEACALASMTEQTRTETIGLLLGRHQQPGIGYEPTLIRVGRYEHDGDRWIWKP